MKKICVVSYDAGPSEVISAWALRLELASCDLVAYVGGPAKKIFSRRFPELPLHDIEKFNDALSDTLRPDLVVTGASWGTNCERLAWIRCAELRLRSAAVVEGWGDFSNGFYLNGELVLPGEVWIYNQRAFSQVEKLGVPPEKIILQTNFYLRDMAERIRALELSTFTFPQENRRLLYVCENISSCEAKYERKDGHLRGYSEFEALEYFLIHALKGTFGNNLRIRIRPHPSEGTEKYLATIKPYRDRLLLEFSPTGQSLEQDLAWSNCVVGCESMAMAVAVECGKEVFSCVPEHALIGCRLPHPEIQHVKSSVTPPLVGVF